MERINSVVVEISGVQDTRVGQSVDGCAPSSNGIIARGNMTNDSSSYEKCLLDDLDSYWDELNDRLSVSRMVSSSVIKGIVNAVVAEANEKIASNDTEIAMLKERLHAYESNAGAGAGARSESLVVMPMPVVINGELESAKSLSDRSCLDTNLEWDLIEHLSRLRITIEEQIQMLKEDLECGRRSNLPSRKYVDVGLCSTSPQGNNEKLLKIDERVDGLEAIIAAGFGQINDMSMKALVREKQWENEFQREVSGVMIRSYIKDLWDDFGTKLYEQAVAMRDLNKNWQKEVAELTNLREELHAFAKSLLSSELGMQHAHNSHEILEECSVAKKKDHYPRKMDGNQHSPSPAEENGDIIQEKSEDSGEVMLEVDFPHLMHMTKEEMISHFRAEMTMMKRQHESALQEKTEALFKLKREYLKERGSSHFRKDKEYENLRKIVPEIILKLNEILAENEMLPPISNDHDELRSFKDTIDTLFFENQRLRGLLVDKREEVKCLLLQVSAAANQMSLHSSAEANFMKQINQLKGDLEDLKIETILREELYKHILRELIVDQKFGLDDMEIGTKTMHDVFSIILRGVVQDAMSTINSNLSKYHMEKTCLQENLYEKENRLSLEIEENQRLKQNIALLSASMKEKEKLASETGSTLMQQKEQFDSVYQEQYMLRNKLSKLEKQISNFKTESDSMKSRLDQASQQIHDYEVEIEKLNKKLKSTSNALEEAEKQKAMLQSVEEKQLSSSICENKQQAKQLMELSKAVMDFENKFSENIKRIDSRLKILSYQLSPLAQHARQLTKRELWYSQILEIRCSNLQKAEAEVDLLGDEVDALLDLLEKIYIALDHYSPVLQHYPGVMEILKLVERELKGENI